MVVAKAVVRQSILSLSAETVFADAARLQRRPVTTPVSDDEIRNHAYQLYELRGRTEGCALEDWIAAERYLRALKNRANKVIFR